MAKGTGVFDVTRAQLKRWEYENGSRFELNLCEGMPGLLVHAGVEDGEWKVTAESWRKPERVVDYENEIALGEVHEGLTGVVEYEAWRVVDMPDIHDAYEADGKKLFELDHVADCLEQLVMSRTNWMDPQEHIAADGSVLPDKLTREQCAVMQAVVDIRNLVGDIVRG